MKIHRLRSKFTLILSVAILTIMLVLVLVVLPSKRSSKEQPETKRVTQIPQIVTKVKNLEAETAIIKRKDEPTATVAVEIRNKSDKPVIAVAIESGNEIDSSGVNRNGFHEGDEPPSVVLQPHGTITLEMPLSNLRPDEPIKISGVMYADGTEEGDEATLGTMRRQKEHYKTPKKGGTLRP